MKKQIFVVMSALLIAFSLPVAVEAQWYRGNLKETLKQLEEDTDRFAKSLDSDLDHSRHNGSRREDEINAYVHAFEEATDRLKDRCTALVEFAQVPQPLLERAQLGVVEAAGHLFAVARDERNRRPAVEQVDGSAHLVLADADLRRDPLVD